MWALGAPICYNPYTGMTTWESHFEASEDPTSLATSLASVGSRESLETERGQYWDEESLRVFFYKSLPGEKAWEDKMEVPEEESQVQLEHNPA